MVPRQGLQVTRGAQPKMHLANQAVHISKDYSFFCNMSHCKELVFGALVCKVPQQPQLRWQKVHYSASQLLDTVNFTPDRAAFMPHTSPITETCCSEIYKLMYL